jgi:hypothetical protein
MLKIKDNINSIELDSFLLNRGFYTRDDDKLWRKYGHFKICKNNHILPLNGGGNDRFDIIYDLIQANMVEKVEDK